MIKRIYMALFASFLCLLTFTAFAEKSKEVDDYIIHYNAMNTTMLLPEVAKTYKIVRSKRRGLLMVSVRKKEGDKPGEDVSVNAEVEASAINLTQQLKNISMKEVIEGDGTHYYIGVFNISNEEVLDFTVKVDPEKQGQVTEIEFRQQFFID